MKMQSKRHGFYKEVMLRREQANKYTEWTNGDAGWLQKGGGWESEIYEGS